MLFRSSTRKRMPSASAASASSSPRSSSKLTPSTSRLCSAIAERFNVTVLGRHTALGDALVTAEIWLRLIPLLQEQGIHTLRQAREAAQKTYYARLKY